MLMHRRLAAGADLSCTSGTTGEISKAELAAERGRGVIPSEESPPDLVLRGAHVLTLAPGCKPIPKGGLAVRGGVIVAVGPDDELEGLAARARRVVDGGDSALIPGLINAHSHVACTQHRGLIENLALEPWLQAVWAVESHYVTPQTTFLGALIGLAELLLSGVTTTIDMFWLGEPAAEAAKRLGMRISTGSWFFDGPSVCGVDAADWPKRAESFFDRWAGDDLVIPGCFPHAAYTVGPESLRQAHAIAERRGGLFSTHAAETRAEQRIIAERHGRTVIRHLDALGLLGPRTVLAHCVHLDDGEIELLARSGATVSHNPVSNLKLGSGIARIPDMLAAGVRVAIGTDSCISGNDIDMWLSMRLSALLPKGAREDPTLISPLRSGSRIGWGRWRSASRPISRWCRFEARMRRRSTTSPPTSSIPPTGPTSPTFSSRVGRWSRTGASSRWTSKRRSPRCGRWAPESPRGRRCRRLYPQFRARAIARPPRRNARPMSPSRTRGPSITKLTRPISNLPVPGLTFREPSRVPRLRLGGASMLFRQPRASLFRTRRWPAGLPLRHTISRCAIPRTHI
jgi:5-methylthioadenosine/S-adenosylhomocysteine deaminase